MFVERNYKKGRKGGGEGGGEEKKKEKEKEKREQEKKRGGSVVCCTLVQIPIQAATQFPTPVPTLCHSLSLSLRHNHARPQVPTQVLI
jgi:hypothetical protein